MKIFFYGAAQDVTGSKHLIETNNKKILLDCGMHQGSRSKSSSDNNALPFDSKSVNSVILSHGHLDHCGMLPVLVKEGYANSIYCTHATAEIAKLIMEDAANVQKQDYEYLERHHEIGDPDPQPPTYGKTDVANVIPHFQSTSYFRISRQWTEIDEAIRFKFYDAGHILGSAITLFETLENGETKRLAYTGDLGQSPVPILEKPETIVEPTENLIIECTYGDRDHRPNSAAMADLQKIIINAEGHDRVVVMPAFSLGRVQEIIYMLHKLYDDPKTPKIPIYVDSPLAERLIPIFERHVEDYSLQVEKDFGVKHEKPFEFAHLTYLRTPDESKKLNFMKGPMIIIGSSGMMEGGRILHHLEHRIEDHNTLLVITGYQAEGTLGRRIKDGQSPVRILGRTYQVNAEIAVLDEFSAHADRSDLLAYIKTVPGLKRVFLVHTENQASESFKELLNKELPQLEVHAPNPGDSFEV
jgi:metallo-beta-lactamase family protein